jgi:putative transcription antitermination factor YqgF
MNYLGLDYGLTHLGIAFSDGPLASPLTTIPTSQAAKLLPVLVDTHHVDEIIIGRPDKTLKLKFNEFINYLKILNFKFQIVDETLSSYDARQKLLHTTQTRRRKKEHSVAAALILQSWLDSVSD